jgi:hypothetical protein
MMRKDVLIAVFPVFEGLMTLTKNNFEWFPMCSSAGIALLGLMQSLIPEKALNGDFSDLEDGWTLHEVTLTAIREAGKAFDTALSLQFDHLDVYRVMPKGTHDTRKLIEHPNLAFGSLWPHVVKLAQTDWTAASRCLAFDLATACGFHAIRAMEAQVLGYLKTRNVSPKKRDLGHYVDLLREERAAKEATNLVDHLRANHRNPLMHPEDNLEITEALTVFDLTKGTIIYLIHDAQTRGMIV